MVERLDSGHRHALKLWPIALLRAYTGVYFAWHGAAKIIRGNFAEGMSGFLNRSLETSPQPYRLFVEDIVLPNAGVFAGLVAWGELAIGVALVIGLATRYAAFCGALMVLNFWLAKGGGVFSGASSEFLWMILFMVLGLVPAGRIAGLDDGLSDRLPFLR
ncbi:MAG: DoxX family protein [Gammaproteobacteria bacterium]|nr:DoxX family protein [Gammaproteobacteria bacterium]